MVRVGVRVGWVRVGVKVASRLGEGRGQSRLSPGSGSGSESRVWRVYRVYGRMAIGFLNPPRRRGTPSNIPGGICWLDLVVLVECARVLLLLPFGRLAFGRVLYMCACVRWRWYPMASAGQYMCTWCVGRRWRWGGRLRRPVCLCTYCSHPKASKAHTFPFPVPVLPTMSFSLSHTERS